MESSMVQFSRRDFWGFSWFWVLDTVSDLLNSPEDEAASLRPCPPRHQLEPVTLAAPPPRVSWTRCNCWNPVRVSGGWPRCSEIQYSKWRPRLTGRRLLSLRGGDVSMSKLLYCAIFLALAALLACSGPASTPAPAAVPVSTPMPTPKATATPAPTPAPDPTATLAPASTPVPHGNSGAYGHGRPGCHTRAHRRSSEACSGVRRHRPP